MLNGYHETADVQCYVSQVSDMQSPLAKVTSNRHGDQWSVQPDYLPMDLLRPQVLLVLLQVKGLMPSSRLLMQWISVNLTLFAYPYPGLPHTRRVYRMNPIYIGQAGRPFAT